MYALQVQNIRRKSNNVKNIAIESKMLKMLKMLKIMKHKNNKNKNENVENNENNIEPYQ